MDYFSNMNGSKNIVCWKEVKMCADSQYGWIIIEWKQCSNMQDHFLSKITRNKLKNMQFSTFIQVKSTCSSSSSCILTIPPLTLLFLLFFRTLSLFLLFLLFLHLNYFSSHPALPPLLLHPFPLPMRASVTLSLIPACGLQRPQGI